MNRTALTNWLLVALLIVVVVASFVIGSSNTHSDEPFAGTDSVVTTQLEESGAEPWFEPLFSVDSGELESGLFALQAGLGGALFGYCIGVLHARNTRRGQGRVAGATAATPSGQG